MKRKIKFVLILFLFAKNLFSQSPNWLWVKTAGYPFDNDVAFCSALDASSNIYTTGQFYGTVDFDPGPGVVNLTAPGNENLFITKSDSSGNLIWAKGIGSANGARGTSIAVDTAGNNDVYVTGHYYGTVDFDPGPNVFNLPSTASDDLFICKFDSSGNFLWAKAIGGIFGDWAYGIAVDPSGNGDVYSTGYFQGTVDFDPGAGTFNLVSVGVNPNFDVYVSKLDSAGNFLWAKSIGGTTSCDLGTFITVDAFRNVYVAGAFCGTADLNPGPGILNFTSNGSSDFFILKLDSTGAFLWADVMGGTYADAAYSIAIDNDASGNVYFTGGFGGTVDFDPGPGTFNLIATPANRADIFICKLDTGGHFIWVKQIAGSENEIGYAIALDKDKNIYTTGHFDFIVDFDPGAGMFHLLSAGFYDLFVLKLDSAGNFMWVKTTGGPGYEGGLSILLNPSGNVYVSGYFGSMTVPFDAVIATNTYNADTYQDIFIAKIDHLFAGIENLNSDNGMYLFPNPSTSEVTISFGKTIHCKVQLSNTIGEVLEEIKTNSSTLSFNLADRPKGIYFITAIDEEGNKAVRKIVKM
jgi:hypothetical protein